MSFGLRSTGSDRRTTLMSSNPFIVCVCSLAVVHVAGRSCRTITRWSGVGAGCARKSASAEPPPAVRPRCVNPKPRDADGAQCLFSETSIHEIEQIFGASSAEPPLSGEILPRCAAGFIGVKKEAPAHRPESGRADSDRGWAPVSLLPPTPSHP